MRNLSILHPYEGGVSNNSLLARAPLYPRCVGHVILISHVVFAVCALSGDAEIVRFHDLDVRT